MTSDSKDTVYLQTSLTYTQKRHHERIVWCRLEIWLKIYTAYFVCINAPWWPILSSENARSLISSRSHGYMSRKIAVVLIILWYQGFKVLGIFMEETFLYMVISCVLIWNCLFFFFSFLINTCVRICETLNFNEKFIQHCHSSNTCLSWGWGHIYLVEKNLMNDECRWSEHIKKLISSQKQAELNALQSLRELGVWRVELLRSDFIENKLCILGCWGIAFHTRQTCMSHFYH